MYIQAPSMRNLRLTSPIHTFKGFLLDFLSSGSGVFKLYLYAAYLKSMSSKWLLSEVPSLDLPEADLLFSVF